MVLNYLVNSREMKQIDKDTIEGTGIPSMVLMERAALAVAEEIWQRVDAPSVLCICGCGNNGADGLAVARILSERGIYVAVSVLGNEEKATKEWREQRKILENLNIPTVTESCLSAYNVIVDAIFGIGLGRNVEGQYARRIEEINGSGALVIAVDMPSGISADTGEVLGTAVKADITVTFGLWKAGLVFYPGAEYAGEVLVKQIGFSRANIEKAEPKLYTFGREALAGLPKRRPDDNKGTAGKLLIIAGSKNMAGAAYLCASAAYRAGAGLVRIVTPEANREILQMLLPEAVLAAYEDVQRIKGELLEYLDWADAVAAGPGIGCGEASEELLRELSAYAMSHKGKTYVLDADALNIISRNKTLFAGFAGCAVITPHMGEMARLMDTNIAMVQKERIALAKKAGIEYNIICVLKDARTIVCEGEGPCYVNRSGNGGMATAGSGDVLCGLIASLAIKLPARHAAELGVYLHGLAGDKAKQRLGEHSMMARDIVEGLAEVLKEV